MASFLSYCPPMSRKSQNGKFMDLLKYILWDFDKKSGYFLFLLSIDADRHTCWWSILFRKGIALTGDQSSRGCNVSSPSPY